MRQPSLSSSQTATRSNANLAGKNGRQLNAPSNHGQPVLQAAADKKKKPAAMKAETSQFAEDKKKKPAAMKAETSQFADDKKKKPAAMKAETSQFADDKKKKPAAMKAETSQFADDKKKKPASMKAESSSPNKMPEHVQHKMESSMGADFSDVNIHVGSKASSVGALAYTQGNDIHFAQGKFNPNTQSGQSLLGHELAHVVQQRAGRVKATTSVNGLPVNDDRSLEKEADVMGAKAAAAK